PPPAVVEPPAQIPAPAQVDPTPEPEPEAPEAPAGTLTVADVRRLWPEVLGKVQAMRRFAWVMLSQNAQVVDLEGTMLTIGLSNAGARDSFMTNKVAEPLARALTEVLGGSWSIDTMIDVTATPTPSEPAAAEPAVRPGVTGAAAQAVRDRLSQPVEDAGDPDADARADDEVVDYGLTYPEELLTRELGAQIIDDTPHG
ncbi:MAG: DNA polymerase III subunit gamma/tau, partial [Aeromicrobium sp.]